MSKLRQSRLGRFFTKTVITSNLHKKKDLIFFRKKYGEDILLIDDSREVAATARALGIKVIRIRRGIKGPVYYKKLLTKILKSYEVGNR
jgi:FMN phosphatase YigB (HAD superfamily)